MEGVEPPLKRQRTESFAEPVVSPEALAACFEQLHSLGHIELSLSWPSAKLAKAAYDAITTTSVPSPRERINLTRFLNAAIEGRPPDELATALTALQDMRSEMQIFAEKAKQAAESYRARQDSSPPKEVRHSPPKYDKELFQVLVKGLQGILVIERSGLDLRSADDDPGMMWREALPRLVPPAQQSAKFGKLGMTPDVFLAKAAETGAIQLKVGADTRRWIRLLMKDRRSSRLSDREGSHLTTNSTLSLEPEPMVSEVKPSEASIAAAAAPDVPSDTLMEVCTPPLPIEREFKTPPLPKSHTPPRPAAPKLKTPPLPGPKASPLPMKATESSPVPDAVDLAHLVDDCLVGLHIASRAVDRPNVRHIVESLSHDARDRLEWRARERKQEVDGFLVELLDSCADMELADRDGWLGWKITQKGANKISPLLRYRSPPSAPRSHSRKTSMPSPDSYRQSDNRSRSYTHPSAPLRGGPRSNAQTRVAPLLRLLWLRIWDKAGWIDTAMIEDDFRALPDYRAILEQAQVTSFTEFVNACLDANLIDRRWMGTTEQLNLTEVGEQNRH